MPACPTRSPRISRSSSAIAISSLGDAKTADTINFNGTNLVNNPFEFKDITSHDFKLGLRWMCCDDGTTLRRAAYAPPPVYAPQPVYAQPAQVLQVPPTYAPPPPPVYAQPQYAPPPPPVYPQQQYAPPPQPTYPPQQPYQQPPLNRRG